MSGLIVDRVVPGSIAEELEIEPGDRLLCINGQPLRDIIDYNYYGGDDDLLLELEKGDGELWELEVEREDGEPLGLIFPPRPPPVAATTASSASSISFPRGSGGRSTSRTRTTASPSCTATT